MTTPDYFGGPVSPKEPDYFADAGRPRRADFRKHESDVARRAGERQVVGSGNKPGSPGDTMGVEFLREAKATIGASLTVRDKWMRKLVTQALRLNRTPIFEIRLEAAEAPVPTDWVLLPAADFEEIRRGEFNGLR